ncbi:hypothetical protein L6164_026648 [Bauhinia variegata]|uniref:Uncharacterized protein n=1 Tax=Bauhinia variegata TaxID=167791 RepID=A0ACB9LQL1_BAUVA|nr:hypothetical protein L6164_026648 [Bauhinia variegata]
MIPLRNDDDCIFKYLLESSMEFLLVCRYFSDDILETWKFEVYLDFFQSSWKKTEDLGDRMLFNVILCKRTWSWNEQHYLFL